MAAQPLVQRARRATSRELEGIPWWGLLSEVQRWEVAAELKVLDAQPGDVICKVGRPATYWFGVLDGLMKMSNDPSVGYTITFTGIPPGAWFGEGTLLKAEAYRYNIEALRRTVVAGLSAPTFNWLLETSIPFNRYVMNQLNERLGQFIAARSGSHQRPRHPGGAQPGRLVQPGAVPQRLQRFAHHPARAGLPGGLVPATGEQLIEGAV